MPGRCPIFQIRRENDDLWIVHRQQGVMDLGFPTAQAALVFARSEIVRSRAPAWIALWIGDMDFSGYFDPNDPKPVFGIED